MYKFAIVEIMRLLQKSWPDFLSVMQMKITKYLK